MSFRSLSQKKLVSHMRGQWCFDLPDAALSASSRSECEWSRLYSRIASQIKELSRSAHVTGQSLQLMSMIASLAWVTRARLAWLMAKCGQVWWGVWLTNELTAVI